MAKIPKRNESVLAALDGHPELKKEVEAVWGVYSRQGLIRKHLDALEAANDAGVTWRVIMEAFSRETGETWPTFGAFKTMIADARAERRKAECDAAKKTEAKNEHSRPIRVA